jgi:hypothetical protein
MINYNPRKMIYTRRRVFYVIIAFFTMSQAIVSAQLNIGASSDIGEVIAVDFVFQGELDDVVIGEVSIPSRWAGVEILDGESVWESVEVDFIPNLNRPVATRWKVVRGMNTGEWFVQYRAPKYRKIENGAWEKLIGWNGVVGNSPIGGSRLQRVWPENSVLSQGTWVKFATGQEGVFKIGYSDLVASGINPDTLDFRAIHLYGGGGRMLPFENNEDRPLDLPLITIETDGEEDGVFDSGDALYFHSSGVNSWRWSSSYERWEHELNPWSDSAYYFLNLDGEIDLIGSRISDAVEVSLPVLDDLNTHLAKEFHEIENYNLAHSGREFYGEHFTNLGSQVYGLGFNIPNLVGDSGWVDARIAGRTLGTTSGYKLVCNGEEASTTDISLSPNSLLIAQKRNLSIEVPMTGDGVNVELYFEPGNSEAEGWIDYVRVQARQHLIFSSGQFIINGTDNISIGNAANYTLTAASSVDQVWDVTDPLSPIKSSLSISGDEVSWKASQDTVRRFVAFRYSAAKEVRALGEVSNLNLHSIGHTDLLIITVPQLDSAARRLATLHADRGMRVAVVNQREVFNAFSSGSPDPTALKMLMMMLWDKAESDVDKPKYLLLMGDGTYMNRNLDPDGVNLLTFQSANSESTVSSYVTDDYFGLLEEGMGESPGDKLAIGVGRIPAPTLSHALAYVSKVETYLGVNEDFSEGAGCETEGSTTTFGAWRNRIIFVTDDQDGNNNDGWRHMSDSEVHSNRVAQDHSEYDIIKIYPDSYLQEATPGGERYDEAEAEIDRKVEEGALIIDYIGHGGERGWAHERILNTTTIREWTNKKRLPVFMTATCELSRYDDPEVESAGEMLVFNPDGGSVGMLTTTRTVFSGGNQELNTAFFQTVLDEDSGTSQARCLGDICKDTKNSPLVTSVTNMRNFSLLGDPAILLAYPKHSIYITEVPDTIRSLDHVIMKGYVGTDSGDTLQGFNGFLYPKVFDKRSQISTLDNDNVAGAFSYTMFRNVIHKGLASVVDGVFEFEFVVPRDIDYTLGEGRVSLYAVSEDIDAHGAFEGFIIGGTSEDVEVDDLGPVVDLFMNDSLFVSGGITNEDPWLYARVYDESGINTVGNGIGHDLKAVLDESYDSPFVLNTYFSADLDTYKSGVVRYPFNDLEEGEHSLELKVWDVQNNSTLATTKFIVASSVEVALQDVIAYPNPATDNVSFRLTHNQTCNEVDVEVDIYDATGRKIKAFKTELFSHTGRTDVLKWDLISNDGGEVPAGVYVFQIKMTTKNGASTQYGSKLVVLKP